MCQIKHKIMVLSGKGGVGKSTVAVNLATSLAMAGKQVGLLDVDIHGPSVPHMLNIADRPISGNENTLQPVKVSYGKGMLNVMSIGFLLGQKDEAVIWRGPRKYGVIRQFLKDVEWGLLDYLVVDSPPGTGDEPLAIAELVDKADGAMVITTPQQVAVQDVRRCVVFCRQLHIPVIGVVENMSGFTCQQCGSLNPIFGSDGGKTMAEEMNVPFLGAIPLEPELVVSGDKGTPIVQTHPHSGAAQAFGRIVRTLLEPELDSTGPVLPGTDGQPMKIAVPVTQGILSSHFGHCEQFVLFDVSADGKTIESRQELTPPPHEPGTFPKWLREQGASIVIASGMGARAQSLFTENGVQVVAGTNAGDPEIIVRDFLAGQLKTGANICDH
jgi:Mrp family chromosome partitioning ATPase/predicted Fe-Mo cluster-binding NifX family protein